MRDDDAAVEPARWMQRRVGASAVGCYRSAPPALRRPPSTTSRGGARGPHSPSGRPADLTPTKLPRWSARSARATLMVDCCAYRRLGRDCMSTRSAAAVRARHVMDDQIARSPRFPRPGPPARSSTWRCWSTAGGRAQQASHRLAYRYFSLPTLLHRRDPPARAVHADMRPPLGLRPRLAAARATRRAAQSLRNSSIAACWRRHIVGGEQDGLASSTSGVRQMTAAYAQATRRSLRLGAGVPRSARSGANVTRHTADALVHGPPLVAHLKPGDRASRARAAVPLSVQWVHRPENLRGLPARGLGRGAPPRQVVAPLRRTRSRRIVSQGGASRGRGRDA